MENMPPQNKYRAPERYSHARLADEHGKGQTDPRLAEYAEKVKIPGASLFITGPVGTGKTYGLHAMARHIVEARGGAARVFNFPDALRDIKEDFDRHWTEKHHVAETMRDYRGILMIDDIGAEKQSDWVVETLYGIINHRYERVLPTVITSNVGVDKIGEAYGDRIASRLVEMVGGEKGIIILAGEDRRMV